MKLLVLAALLPISLWALDCAPAGTLAPGGIVAGTLDGNSCTLSDGTLYAPYVLVLPARGQLQIEANSSAADLPLLLRDSAGSLLDSGKAISRNVERGVYKVVVNASVPGDFTLTAAFTAELGTLCSDFAP